MAPPSTVGDGSQGLDLVDVEGLFQGAQEVPEENPLPPGHSERFEDRQSGFGQRSAMD